MPIRTLGLGGIFNHTQPMFFREGVEPIAVDWQPGKIYRHDRAGPTRDGIRNPREIDQAGIGCDVDESRRGTDFEYYLEPAGVLHGPLVCTRAAEDRPQRAGLLMTRAGWKAKTLFLDDGVNPETYELSFPKEFGYVKPLAHYKPSAREHAKFPWSKKY